MFPRPIIFSRTSVFRVKTIENFAEWKYYGIFV